MKHYVVIINHCSILCRWFKPREKNYQCKRLYHEQGSWWYTLFPWNPHNTHCGCQAKGSTKYTEGGGAQTGSPVYLLVKKSVDNKVNANKSLNGNIPCSLPYLLVYIPWKLVGQTVNQTDRYVLQIQLVSLDQLLWNFVIIAIFSRAGLHDPIDTGPFGT